METTYPHLKAYCQQKGFEFQIVDMRWGIRDEATNDHMTTEICLQEIANCQKYSAGPNFLVCRFIPHILVRNVKLLESTVNVEFFIFMNAGSNILFGY